MQRAHCYEGARDCEGVRGRRGEAAVAATATVAATAAEVGCNGLERGWRTVSVAREREGNDRLDSNILLPVKLSHFVTLLRRYRRP